MHYACSTEMVARTAGILCLRLTLREERDKHKRGEYSGH